MYGNVSFQPATPSVVTRRVLRVSSVPRTRGFCKERGSFVFAKYCRTCSLLRKELAPKPSRRLLPNEMQDGSGSLIHGNHWKNLQVRQQGFLRIKAMG